MEISTTQNNEKRFKKIAWLILLSFGFTYLFFYNGRQNINLVMTQMAEDLGSSIASLGVVSSALFWCYAFGQLVSGRLGSIFGHKRFIIIGIIGSAILNVAISFQHNISVIAVLWGLNGFFQSMVWSNGLGVVNKWWPSKKRCFATGLTTFFSGMAQVTTYLSVLLCLQLNPEWSWRAAFRFPMLPLLLSLIAFILLVYTTFRTFSKNVYKRRAELDKFLAVKRKIKKKRDFRRLVLRERKEYVYFKCPYCKEYLRVPRGRGKIIVTCRVCHRKFDKKT
jgi:sugar phosphate permease